MRFVVLDGWRGIAALCVALFHLQEFGYYPAGAFVRHSFLFVDFFFVLSGFVLTHAYRDRLNGSGQFADFVVRRVGRIYPLHIAIVLLLVLLECAHLAAHSWTGGSGLREPFTDAASPGAILSNIFLFQGLGVHDQLTLNNPSWSISAEFWTYLVFALVCLAAGRGQRTLGVAAAALAGLGAAVVGRYSPDFIDTTYSYGFFRCLYGFFIGVLTSLAFKAAQPPRLAGAPATACELLCVAGSAAFICWAGNGQWSLASPLLFAVVVGVFACERGAVSRLLASRPITWLGALSYSIYMCHFVLLQFMRQGFGVLQKLTAGRAMPASGAWQTHALALAYLALVVLLAAATCRFVENPGRRHFNRLAADLAARRASKQIVRVAFPNADAVAGFVDAASDK